MMSWCIDSKANTLAHQHLDLAILRKGCMKFGDEDNIRTMHRRECEYRSFGTSVLKECCSTEEQAPACMADRADT